MSFKDKLKQSQGTGSSYPRLPLIATIEIKDSPTGVPEFQCYDKEQKANVKVGAPLKGIFIGSAMQISAYSDNIGSKGGNYKSDFYIKTDNINLYEPQRDGRYKSVVKGTMDEVTSFLSNIRPAVTVKKRQVIFLLTEGGLVAVVTNMSIAIQQIGDIRDRLQENMISLTPTLFDEGNPKITKKTKEYLGKFRQKNPPKYADIEVAELITEEVFDAFNGGETTDAFLAWKKHIESPQKPTEQDEQVTGQQAPAVQANQGFASQQPASEFAPNSSSGLPWENDPMS